MRRECARLPDAEQADLTEFTENHQRAPQPDDWACPIGRWVNIDEEGKIIAGGGLRPASKVEEGGT